MLLVGIEGEFAVPHGLANVVFSLRQRLRFEEDRLFHVGRYDDDAVDVTHDDVSRSDLDTATHRLDASVKEFPPRDGVYWRLESRKHRKASLEDVRDVARTTVDHCSAAPSCL